MKSNLEKLPEFCLSILETNPPGKYVIGIYKGEDCYRSTTYDTHDLAKAKELANHINKKLGVTAAQRECMEAGSMFGWNVPGAQLDYVEALHKKTSRKEIILTDSDWAERFKPLMNPYGEKQGSFSGWDEENPEQGCLFNSAGKDLAYIQDIMAGKVDGLSAAVWAFMDGEVPDPDDRVGKRLIEAGYSFNEDEGDWFKGEDKLFFDFIGDGFHFVNVIGYLVTRIPAEPNNTYIAFDCQEIVDAHQPETDLQPSPAG